MAIIYPLLACNWLQNEWPWVPISCQNPFSTSKAVARLLLRQLGFLVRSLDQELILYRYSSCCCWSNLFSNSQRLHCFESDLDEIWLEEHSSSISKYALAGSDFRFYVMFLRWQLWRHFTQKSAAAWWGNTKHLPADKTAVYASSWSIVHYFVLVINSSFLVYHSNISLISVNCTGITSKFKYSKLEKSEKWDNECVHKLFSWLEVFTAIQNWMA